MKIGEQVEFYRISRKFYDNGSLISYCIEMETTVGTIGVIKDKFGDYYAVEFPSCGVNIIVGVYIHKNDIRSIRKKKLERILL